MENGKDPLGHIDLDGQDWNHTHLFQNRDKARISDQSDRFSAAQFFGQSGDEEIRPIVACAAEECISILDPLGEEDLSITPIPVNEGCFRKALCEIEAPLFIRIKDPDCNF